MVREPVVTAPVIVERNPKRDIGWLLLGIGAVLGGIAALIFVLWLFAATVKATPFDADGVRCYGSILAPQCLKTAEPPR